MDNFLETFGICDTKFWDWDLFWNGSQPRLTTCFQHSVLATAPCVCLVLPNLFNLCFRCSWQQQPPVLSGEKWPRTLLYFGKILFTILLISITLLHLTYLVYLQGTEMASFPIINYLSVVVRLIGLVFALVLQIHHNRNGILNSKTLFIFWMTSSVGEFFISPSPFELITGRLPLDTEKFVFILTSISYPIYVAQMFLSVFTDPAYSLLFKPGEDDYVSQHQPVLSRLFFTWMTRLIRYGYKNKIEIKDLDRLSPDLLSTRQNAELQKRWLNEIRKQQKRPPTHRGKPSLFWAVAKTLAIPLSIAAILELAYDLVTLVPALLLEALIGFIEDPDEPAWHGVIYAVSMFIISFISMLLMVHSTHYTILASFVPKYAVSAAIYRKSLKLSSAARHEYTVGELCNLLAVDTQKLFELMWSVNLVWSAPLRVILTLALLWRYLGIACLAGMATMLLIMPVTLYVASKTHRIQELQMARKDKRLRQMSEILNGIKVLKLFAWELPFMEQISEIRRKEVSTIRKLALLNAVVVFFWSTAPFLVAISSFVTYLLMDPNNVLDPSVAFVSLTLFNKLRAAISMIPDVIAEVIQSRVSFRRLQKFLLSDEINEDDIGKTVPEGKAVMIENASLAWTSMAVEEPFLRDVTAEVPEGCLIGVVGQVGAGKSALLSALLGEMHLTAGKINIREGTIAYVSQQAWIQNATVQDNILFLKSMDRSKYNDALDRCCLRDDLEILPDGDQTEIGEKGVNLSGGQKQRVSLARALYQNADLYLLDDPLSAVDGHVGAHIFTKVIGPKGALNNKTRILVTHNLAILPEMDVIFAMANGRIEEVGSYEQLMKNEGEFAKFVEDHLKKIKESELQDIDGDAKSNIPGDSQNNTPESPTPSSLSTAELKEQMKRTGSRLSRAYSKQDSLVLKQQQKTEGKLVKKETMEEGKVKAAIFLTYFQNASIHLIILMMISFVAYQGFQVGANFWLSKWSMDDSNDIQMRNLRMWVYGSLGLGQGLCILAGAFLLAIAATRASKLLHSKMVASILRSPMSFFESTPVGRVLNRCGRDTDVIDHNIPTILSRLLQSAMSVFATVAVISASSPILILVVLPLVLFYACIQNVYLATSRQCRRIYSVTVSPIMSNFSETVQGASTIRAFRAQNAFIRKEDSLVDDSSRALLCCTLLNRWFSIWLESAASLLVLMVALFFVLRREDIGAGLTGLTLSYTLDISVVIGVLLKVYTNLEIRMISVERMMEYSLLPPEAPWKLECGKSPPKGWPTEGAITFDDYQLKYRKSISPVLKGIHINISPKEKVGIVGRTGAGKSSLTVGLFRIVESCGGSIRIDGIDISTLGLHDLRSQLTIIPQDPVLFSGTLRLNLDPFREHLDGQLWAALDHAHLKDFVSGLDSGLEFYISEGGENVSVGQRQQICLARALLKKTKILVLDEATAAVDMETDRLIQETIRQEFDDCTVLTIAHRLYTILDYDRIIVMDSGRIAEEGKPDILLQNENSKFFQLAKNAGLL